MDSNKQLVEYLESREALTSEKVKKAFLKTDRKRFVPDNRDNKAYGDSPVPLLEGSTVSAPHIVARITELADIQPDSKVLELGSGSGYQLSILSFLGDEITGIEPVEQLVSSSRELLSDRKNVEVIKGKAPNDVEGVFDRIIVSYAIDAETWNVLKRNLKPDGIMVGAVEENGSQRLRKYSKGSEELLDYVRFVGSR